MEYDIYSPSNFLRPWKRFGYCVAYFCFGSSIERTLEMRLSVSMAGCPIRAIFSPVLTKIFSSTSLLPCFMRPVNWPHTESGNCLGPVSNLREGCKSTPLPSWKFFSEITLTSTPVLFLNCTSTVLRSIVDSSPHLPQGHGHLQ